MVAYTPDKQEYYITQPIEAVRGETATLGELCAAFGEGISVAWLIPEILHISEYCGCKDKMTDAQLESTARLIAKAYPWLKVSELSLFFGWLKLGRYGHFYGSVDSMIIAEALREFIVWRNLRLDEFHAEKNVTQKWSSYEEYKEAMKKQAEFIRNKPSKKVVFTARSPKTKVGSIFDVIRKIIK